MGTITHNLYYIILRRRDGNNIDARRIQQRPSRRRVVKLFRRRQDYLGIVGEFPSENMHILQYLRLRGVLTRSGCYARQPRSDRSRL